MKILIIGGSGFLGKKLVSFFSKKHELIWTYFSKKEEKGIFLDIASKEDVQSLFLKYLPDVVIHASALTDVDLCEKEKKLAKSINVTGTKNIADSCKKIRAKLVFLSTDYIFDGKEMNYVESSKPHPLNYYGQTKLMGEKIVMDTLSDYLIIRPAIMYGYNDKNDKTNFTISTIMSLSSGEKILADASRIKYPTLIDDIASGINLLLEKKCSGIFHISGDKRVTRYQWALRIASIFNLPQKNIIKHTMEEKVPKPRKVFLVTGKIKKLGMMFTSLEDGLKMIKNKMS